MISLPVHSFYGLECTRVASLAFLVYEICITLDEEIEYIWMKPNNVWLKWQYLFTRYFALVVLIANRSAELLVTTPLGLPPPSIRNWFLCQVVVGGALLISVELVLMARVYALYNYSVSIAYLFGSLVVCEIISVVAGVALKHTNQDLTLDMVTKSSPDSFIYFGVVSIVSQTIILALTIRKYNFSVKVGHHKNPIMTLMIRDGSIAFVAILLVTAWTLLSAITDRYPSISDSWFLAIVSCAGCRLVINLLQSSRGPDTFPEGEIGFGTVELSTVAETNRSSVSLGYC